MKITILVKDSTVGQEIFEHVQNIIKDFFPEEEVELEILEE